MMCLLFSEAGVMILHQDGLRSLHQIGASYHKIIVKKTV